MRTTMPDLRTYITKKEAREHLANGTGTLTLSGPWGRMAAAPEKLDMLLSIIGPDESLIVVINQCDHYIKK